MKINPILSALLVLFGLAAAAAGTFLIARPWRAPEQVSASGDPPLSQPDLPSQSVNGITAWIESYYADANRLIFVVRIHGDEDNYSLDDVSLKQVGGEIYDSYEVKLLSDDASLFSVDLVTANPLDEERLNGQFAFKVFAPDGEDPPLADFKFDLDLPVSPGLIFNPKQSVSANGVEILLDRVVMTPAFTQIYLCYIPPTDADWRLSGATMLQVDSQTGSMQTYNTLFDDRLAGMDENSEPGWIPPVQDGRCVKIGFQVGDAHPKSFTLTIPALEQLVPADIPEEDLAVAYKKLEAKGIEMEWHLVDHGAYMEYKKLPEGMTRDEAFRCFAEALGYAYPGEWVFEVPLDSQSDKK